MIAWLAAVLRSPTRGPQPLTGAVRPPDPRGGYAGGEGSGCRPRRLAQRRDHGLRTLIVAVPRPSSRSSTRRGRHVTLAHAQGSNPAASSRGMA